MVSMSGTLRTKTSEVIVGTVGMVASERVADQLSGLLELFAEPVHHVLHGALGVGAAAAGAATTAGSAAAGGGTAFASAPAFHHGAGEHVAGLNRRPAREGADGHDRRRGPRRRC